MDLIVLRTVPWYFEKSSTDGSFVFVVLLKDGKSSHGRSSKSMIRKSNNNTKQSHISSFGYRKTISSIHSFVRSLAMFFSISLRLFFRLADEAVDVARQASVVTVLIHVSVCPRSDLSLY